MLTTHLHSTKLMTVFLRNLPAVDAQLTATHCHHNLQLFIGAHRANISNPYSSKAFHNGPLQLRCSYQKSARRPSPPLFAFLSTTARAAFAGDRDDLRTSAHNPCYITCACSSRCRSLGPPTGRIYRARIGCIDKTNTAVGSFDSSGNFAMEQFGI